MNKEEIKERVKSKIHEAERQNSKSNTTFGQGILTMVNAGFDELIEGLFDELDRIINNGK